MTDEMTSLPRIVDTPPWEGGTASEAPGAWIPLAAAAAAAGTRGRGTGRGGSAAAMDGYRSRSASHSTAADPVLALTALCARQTHCESRSREVRSAVVSGAAFRRISFVHDVAQVVHGSSPGKIRV